MTRIYQVQSNEDISHAQEIIWEYLRWANSRVKEEYTVSVDIKSIHKNFFLELENFLPPNGCLLLAEHDGYILATVSMRRIRKDTCEILRLYVRPEYRRRRLGKTLLEKIINKAQIIGYSRILLDSPRYMNEAHTLYQSAGFRVREPYPECEIPKEFHKYWLFMEKQLS